MFGLLAVGYLFLGGAGAGAIVVVSLVDLVWFKEPFGGNSRVSIDAAQPCERLLAFASLAGMAALVLGMLCLLFDLGRIDRVADLFLRPTFSLLTIGTFALGALVLCGAFLVIVRFAYLPAVRRPLVVGVQIVAVILGVVVMLYTGLLLQSLGSVAFWKSAFLPALFVLSSLSCGMAAMLIIALFGETDACASYLIVKLARFDMVIIALEAFAAALLVGLALAGDHPAAAVSAQQLAIGDFALLWWVGFVLCGLAIPLVIEGVSVKMISSLQTALAVAAVFVLIGGFSVRLALVEAGSHRDLVLESAPAQLSLDGEGEQVKETA